MGAAGGADAAAATSQPEEGLACSGGEVCWREELRKAMKVALVPNCGCQKPGKLLW